MLRSSATADRAGEQGPVATSYSYDGVTKRLTGITIGNLMLSYPYLVTCSQVDAMTVGNLKHDPGVDRNKAVSKYTPVASQADTAGGQDTQVLSSTGNTDDNAAASNGGMNASESIDGQTTTAVTSLPSGGVYTRTTTHPDQTQTLDTYTDGLLTDEKTLREELT